MNDEVTRPKTETIENKIRACLSGVELLQTNKLQPYFSQIRHLVSCPDKIYRHLYLNTIYRTAEFCQAMSFSKESFSNDYGFLERQLKLATTLLKLRRGILLPKNAVVEQISAEEAQWTYALFSATLLRDMYALQSNREVYLHDNKGNKNSHWLPLSGSLYERSIYYSIDLESKNNPMNIDVVMAGLSGRIIPSDACIWLSSNSYLYKHWWDALLHQSLPENPIEQLIQLAAEKSEISLLREFNKSTQPNLKDIFQNKVAIDASTQSDDILKIPEGLFITMRYLEDFLAENRFTQKSTLFEILEKDEWLLLNEGKPYHELRPKKYEDKRFLNGIILNLEKLPQSLCTLPNNIYFHKKADATR